MDDDDLLARIRERMMAGTLPKSDCVVTWYGQGRGHRCAVCDQRVLSTEIDITCDLPDGGTVYFHGRCHGLWRSTLSR